MACEEAQSKQQSSRLPPAIRSSRTRPTIGAGMKLGGSWSQHDKVAAQRWSLLKPLPQANAAMREIMNGEARCPLQTKEPWHVVPFAWLAFTFVIPGISGLLFIGCLVVI